MGIIYRKARDEKIRAGTYKARMIKLKLGLDLPISGTPSQVIEDARAVRSVALLGGDYAGMRPTMAVQLGAEVQLGEPLFTCKKTDGVIYTSPAGGTISAIHRGERRTLISVVIDVASNEQSREFDRHDRGRLSSLPAEVVRSQMATSGLWTAFRTRPFSKVPSPTGAQPSPAAIFINAMDTNPLAADPRVVLKAAPDDFAAGVEVLSCLTQGEIFVCTAEGAPLDTGNAPRVTQETFVGPHPAGLTGTHIHFLKPVGASRTVWSIGYQDVIATGRLFMQGRLSTERIIALGGPPVTRPRLLRTRLGANLEELAAGELADAETRLVSGSILSGHGALGATAFLGRYDTALGVLREDRTRAFLGYLSSGINKHSAMPIYLSRLRRDKLDITTDAGGSPRGMVPIGVYECLMPLDILPTQLLRALLTCDLDLAIQLGCMELDEEDLALCTYACPGKYEYGPVLRHVLARIEKEG